MGPPLLAALAIFSGAYRRARVGGAEDDDGAADSGLRRVANDAGTLPYKVAVIV